MTPKTATNDCRKLADQIAKAMNGDAWHGPSWRETLDGVPLDAALRHPIPEAHSIAEIVLHMAAWNDVVRRRMNGETPEITEAMDWPVASFRDETEWQAAVGRLFESGNALASTVAAFPPENLHRKRPSVDGTWYDLVLGQLQHVLYHAGQAGLLKKARAK